jgi:hypothetical protein
VRVVSPDFNLIEMTFSKLKALLRKAAERTVNGLWSAIDRFDGLFSADEWPTYFGACGYDRDWSACALERACHAAIQD